MSWWDSPITHGDVIIVFGTGFILNLLIMVATWILGKRI